MLNQGKTMAGEADAELDWKLKGVDPSLEGCTAEALRALKRPLFDDRLLFPIAILHEPVIRANSAWMRRFLSMSGLKIAPHGKTTMSPELLRLQIEDGAWAITAATVHHARCYRRFGVRRIFMANQLVGIGAIEWVLKELRSDPDFDFYCLVDSLENLNALASVARSANIGRALKILIEVGCPNGRCGVRTAEQGMHLAEAAHAHRPWVDLVGLECFEGVVQLNEAGLAAANAMLDLLLQLAAEGAARGFYGERVLLSAGGSGFFDLVASKFTAARQAFSMEPVIRSGCYLSHDDGMYARLYAAARQRTPALGSIGYDLKPALQVWGQILSLPEPGRIICGVGKRDVGYDIEMPKLVCWARPGDAAPREMPAGLAVKALNDQHAFIDGATQGIFKVGDLLGFGVSHPCTTFDKWRALLLVDDAHRFTGFVRSYF